PPKREARPDLRQFGRTFEDLDFPARPPQRDRSREAANPTPDDQHPARHRTVSSLRTRRTDSDSRHLHAPGCERVLRIEESKWTAAVSLSTLWTPREPRPAYLERAPPVIPGRRAAVNTGLDRRFSRTGANATRQGRFGLTSRGVSDRSAQ